MTGRLQDLAAEIIRLQGELEDEVEKRRAELGAKIGARFVAFEHDVLAEQRRLRTGAMALIFGSPWLHIVTAPVIYSLAIPVLLLDAWASLYQAICFRAYRIPRVKRSDHVVFDRGALAYLNWIEALNCLYCGYANGVLAYVREIGSRTEQYWCPIKHALHIADPHRRYFEFLDYGDAAGYRAQLDDYRERLRDDGAAAREVPPTA